MYLMGIFVQMASCFVHLEVNESLVSKIKKINVDGNTTEPHYVWPYIIVTEPGKTLYK